MDQERHATTWNTGEGSYRVGGRWNSKGVRAVYTSVDPATAILEVAVHKGFKVLDTTVHILTSARITDMDNIYVVQPTDVPNPNWLVPGSHGPGQQSYGDQLLNAHLFSLLPSTVSRHSWNLIFDADRAKGYFEDVQQERFGLDPRLHR
nr:RES domain-containing protein [Loktanella sp. M215]